MGEAARRQKNEKLYGKISKDLQSRGLVISNPMSIQGTTINMMSSALDPQELRFSLLYWDELVWPKNRMIWIDSDHDCQFLEKTGILSRPEAFTMHSGYASDIILEAQITTFQNLDAKEPGKWAFSQGERSLTVVEDIVDHKHIPAAMLELQRAIPIPQLGVPLAEILEFKHRRRDELLLLRKHFESLANEIAQSEDPKGSLANKVKEVDIACADLLSVGKEWQFPMMLSSLKASLNIEPTKLAAATAGAYASASYLGLPMAAAIAGLAAAGTILSVKADLGFRGVRRPRNPYRYAYSIDNELI